MRSRFTFIIILWLCSTSNVPAQTSTREQLFSGTFSIKKELTGIHPRLYVTPQELKAVDKEYIWNPVFFKEIIPEKKDSRLRETPRSFNAEAEKNGQTNVALANLAVAYRITRDADYLDMLEHWLPYMESFQPFVKKDGMNNDLYAGSILYHFAIMYDMLHGLASKKTINAIRSVLIKQAGATFEEYSGWKSFPFEQNHLIIPVCGLGIAAMALADEPDMTEKTSHWGAFAQNLLARSFEALSHDGWYFEGISYWNFTISYPLAYAGALKRCTGTDFFEYPLLKNSGLYLAHNILPGMDFVFDFADWGPRVTGNETAQKGYDLPWHTYPTRLTNLTAIYKESGDPFTRAVINRMARQGHSGWECMLQMIWMLKLPNERIKETKDINTMPPYHYFDDMDIVHWRSNWNDVNATAIAFKSGPPAGHHIGTLYAKYPEWRYGNGHAHPDAGSFILFSQGSFVTGDTGYAIKESRWHNTITVDGMGQGNPGSAWTTWINIPYTKLNKVRMENVWLANPVCASTAIFHDGYADTLGLKHIKRHLIMVEGRYLMVYDDIESSAPRTFDWFLHFDKNAKRIANDTWQVENGKSLLTVCNLGEEATATVEPTIVETQVYSEYISRPQQRGYHLNLKSGKVRTHRFITALCVRNTKEDEQVFKAEKTGENAYMLRCGNETCDIRIGSQAGFDGDFAYILKKNGNIVSIGISGKSLATGNEIFTLSNKAQTILYPQGGKRWKSDGFDIKNITIE